MSGNIEVLTEGWKGKPKPSPKDSQASLKPSPKDGKVNPSLHITMIRQQSLTEEWQDKCKPLLKDDQATLKPLLKDGEAKPEASPKDGLVTLKPSPKDGKANSDEPRIIVNLQCYVKLSLISCKSNKGNAM